MKKLNFVLFLACLAGMAAALVAFTKATDHGQLSLAAYLFVLFGVGGTAIIINTEE